MTGIMSKHIKLLYRSIARIRVVNEPNGVVFLDQIRQLNLI